MTITRGELKRDILEILMKESKYPGFYTPEKMDRAIQEAMDFVATEMFLADEGWFKTRQHFTTEAGQVSVPMPTSAAMVTAIRYLHGDTYVPLNYNPANEVTRLSESSGARQYVGDYEMIENDLYFNPPLAEGGANYLQIDFMYYPKRLQSDQDFLNSQFGVAMQHFIKYRSCTILAAGIEKMVIPWSGLEASWYDKMLEIVNKRNNVTKRIGEFLG